MMEQEFVVNSVVWATLSPPWPRYPSKVIRCPSSMSRQYTVLPFGDKDEIPVKFVEAWGCPAHHQYVQKGAAKMRSDCDRVRFGTAVKLAETLTGITMPVHTATSIRGVYQDPPAASCTVAADESPSTCASHQSEDRMLQGRSRPQRSSQQQAQKRSRARVTRGSSSSQGRSQSPESDVCDSRCDQVFKLDGGKGQLAQQTADALSSPHGWHGNRRGRSCKVWPSSAAVAVSPSTSSTDTLVSPARSLSSVDSFSATMVTPEPVLTQSPVSRGESTTSSTAGKRRASPRQRFPPALRNKMEGDKQNGSVSDDGVALAKTAGSSTHPLPPSDQEQHPIPTSVSASTSTTTATPPSQSISVDRQTQADAAPTTARPVAVATAAADPHPTPDPSNGYKAEDLVVVNFPPFDPISTTVVSPTRRTRTVASHAVAAPMGKRKQPASGTDRSGGKRAKKSANSSTAQATAAAAPAGATSLPTSPQSSLRTRSRRAAANAGDGDSQSDAAALKPKPKRKADTSKTSAKVFSPPRKSSRVTAKASSPAHVVASTKEGNSSTSDSGEDSSGEEFLNTSALEVKDAADLSAYKVHDLVWAKSGMDPFWPAMVTRPFKKKMRSLTVRYLSENDKQESIPFRITNAAKICPFAIDQQKHRGNGEKNVCGRLAGFGKAYRKAEDILHLKMYGDQGYKDMLAEYDTASSVGSSASSEAEVAPPTTADVAVAASNVGVLAMDAALQNLEPAPAEEELPQKQYNPKYSDIDALRAELKKAQKTLLQIIAGKKTSIRHNKFKGSDKDRRQLKREGGFGPVTHEGVRQTLHREILDIFLAMEEKQRHCIPEQYVYEVWLPEFLIIYINTVENFRNVPKAEEFYVSAA